MWSSPFRFIATVVPSVRVAVFRFTYLGMPPKRDSMSLLAPRASAAPPTWNVRMVSCVPGSPIDWAAMIPTASPRFTFRPRDRSRP